MVREYYGYRLVPEFIPTKLLAGTQVLTRSLCYVLVTRYFTHSVPPQSCTLILLCNCNWNVGLGVKGLGTRLVSSFTRSFTWAPMRETDKTMWKIGEKWGGGGRGGRWVRIAFDLFALCHILRFRNIKWANAPISPIYNFTLLCQIKLLLLLLFCKFCR